MGRLKFDSIGDFFEEYSTTVLDHYQVSLLVTRELLFKSNQKHKEHSRIYYEKKRQSSQNQKGSVSTSGRHHHISHIHEEIFDSDEEDQMYAHGNDDGTYDSQPAHYSETEDIYGY